MTSTTNSVQNNLGTTTIHGRDVYIGNQFNGSQRHDPGAHLQAILNSLAFPQEHARFQQIADAYPDTFAWISRPELARGRSARTAAADFVRFLTTSQQHLFWITGKVGSGKSSLIKFIRQDSKCQEHLRLWSGDTHLVQLSFYFWSPGAVLERSFVGLLRSLLSQLLSERDELGDDLADQLPERVPTSWSKQELQRLVKQHLTIPKYSFFVLLDGLDESAGNTPEQDELLGFIEAIAAFPNVKLCISSRPEAAFEDVFHEHSNFKMQDVTAHDIRLAVTGRFDQQRHWKELEDASPDEAELFVDELCRKAEGVFLWLHLAVEDVCRGLKQRNSMETLQRRLGFLSGDLYDLFLMLLHRLDPVYRHGTMQTVRARLALERIPLPPAKDGCYDLQGLRSVLSTSLIMNPQHSNNFPPSQSASACEDMFRDLLEEQALLQDHTAGILETRASSEGLVGSCKARSALRCICRDRGDASGIADIPGPAASLFFHFETIGTEFLHRSMRDFFLEDSRARAFIGDEVHAPRASIAQLKRVEHERLALLWHAMAQNLVSFRDSYLEPVRSVTSQDNQWEISLGLRRRRMTTQLVNMVNAIKRSLVQILALTLADSPADAAQCDAECRSEIYKGIQTGRDIFPEIADQTIRDLLRHGSQDELLIRTARFLCELILGDVESSFPDFFKAMDLLNVPLTYTSSEDLEDLIETLANSGASVRQLLYSPRYPPAGAVIQITTYPRQLLFALVNALAEMPSESPSRLNAASRILHFLQHDVRKGRPIGLHVVNFQWLTTTHHNLPYFAEDGWCFDIEILPHALARLIECHLHLCDEETPTNGSAGNSDPPFHWRIALPRKYAQSISILSSDNRITIEQRERMDRLMFLPFLNDEKWADESWQTQVISCFEKMYHPLPDEETPPPPKRQRR